MDSTEPQKPADDSHAPLTFWQVIGSVLAAAVGVQSKVNRARDFSRGRPLHFILAGIIFATVFVLVVIAVVRAVLAQVA